MKFAWIVAVLSTTALGAAVENEQHAKRATATGDEVNWSSLGNAIHSLSLHLPTQTANLDNIDAPPRALIPKIVSAVPPSALAQLVVPAQRASLASEFKAGKTPDWYTSLPTDVKSYLSVVKKQIADGALTAPPKKAAQTGPASADASSTGGSAASATSSGAAAGGAQPTGLVVGGMGALGVLGIALAL